MSEQDEPNSVSEASIRAGHHVQSRPRPESLRNRDQSDDDNAFERVTAAMFSQMRPRQNPLHEKITPDHITTMLDIDREQLGRIAKDRDGDRTQRTTLAILACVFVLALIALLAFTGNSGLIQSVLSGLLGVVIGAFGGYGYGRTTRES